MFKFPSHNCNFGGPLVLVNCDYCKYDVCNMALEGRLRPKVFNTYAHSHYSVVPCILSSRYTRTVLAVIGNTVRLTPALKPNMCLDSKQVHINLCHLKVWVVKNTRTFYAMLSCLVSYTHPHIPALIKCKYQNKKGHKISDHVEVGVHTG